MIERCQPTERNRACCKWGCISTGQSEWAGWSRSIAKNAYNGHMGITTGSQRRVIWSGESHFLSHCLDTWVHMHLFPGEEMAPGCTVRRKQVVRSSVMFWTIFYWKSLGSGIHVDSTLTHTTYLYIAAEQVHSIIAMVFLNSSGLYQLDNVFCHTA